MTARDSSPERFRRGLAGVAAGAAAALALWLAGLPAPGAAIAGGVVAVAVLAFLLKVLRLRARLAVAEAETEALVAQLANIRGDHEALASDLAQLGIYGNLLLESTDLAEALQISQQFLARLLPGCAGSFYPLIDGEGLSEATHLWGTHACETRSQATWNDCRALGANRTYLADDAEPGMLCAHVLAEGNGNGNGKPKAPFSTACLPLVVATEPLGWLYLSAPGHEGIPKLPIAVAAAEQLAQALANLRLRENLRDLSVRDPLTGLFNRRYLAESLGREMARSKRRLLPLTVMMMDLDHFKAFNDNYGHAAGDAVLVAFARLLHQNFRSEDIACRLGGEEFIMIMPEMDRTIAERRAQEMLRDAMSIQLVHEGRELPPVTVSIGLAMFPEDGETPDALMQAADRAVYRSKADGRNRVSFPAAA
jgi:diguanylate cyclase (GGDEF)-like protein